MLGSSSVGVGVESSSGGSPTTKLATLEEVGVAYHWSRSVESLMILNRHMYIVFRRIGRW